MNQNPGILGKKIGMTQLFDEKGEVQRVTVIQAGCIVIAKRTKEKDGYSALVLGLGERKEKHTTKPVAGQFKKAGVSPKKIVRELRCSAEEAAKYEVGSKLPLEQIFVPGQWVDAQAKTIGRGFSGVIRRHHFAGFVQTHGTHEYFRHGGSIGTNMTPGRTLPGVKMPGQHGNKQRTALNLKVVKIIPEDDLILVAGAVPGAGEGTVVLRGAVKKKDQGRPGEVQTGAPSKKKKA
jgi:large subunit ribosomal protein L3